MTEEILAMARLRSDTAEVFSEETDRVVIEFRGGRFHARETRLTHGYGLRVVKDGRVGFSSSTNAEQFGEMVDAAIETAVLGPVARFEFPGPGQPEPVVTFNNRAMQYPPQRMMVWGQALVEAMHARVPELKLDLSFTRTWREVLIRNSAGLEASFERAEFYLAATGLMVDDGLVWLPEYVDLADGRPFALEPLADRLERQARHARRRARLTSGEYPVIVMPLGLPSLLAPLESGIGGRQHQKGTSPLIGREGERVLAECLTLTDNPLRKYGQSSAPVDGEGLPSRTNVLFDHGVFGGFLYDLGTAAACATTSNGAARRRYANPPVPGPSNVEIAPGDADLEDTVRATDEGLLVYGFVGGGQSNVMAGELALDITSGFKIERGEIVGRVKDAMVAGNVYDMLASVDVVGNTEYPLGSLYAPFLRFPAVRVTTSE